MENKQGKLEHRHLHKIQINLDTFCNLQWICNQLKENNFKLFQL